MNPRDVGNGHIKYNGGLALCHHNRYDAKIKEYEESVRNNMSDSVNKVQQRWPNLLLNKPEQGVAHYAADSGDIYAKPVKMHVKAKETDV